MSLRLRQLRLHDFLLGALVLAAAAIPDWRSCEPVEKPRSATRLERPAPARDPQRFPLGLPQVADYDDPARGESRDWARALAAHKAKDWGELEARCRAVIAVEPRHLLAHSLLASALARQGRYDEVGDPLSLTLAADWRHFGVALDGDLDFAEYLASPWGARLSKLAAAYRDEFRRRAREGVLLVGRPKPLRPLVGSGRRRSDLHTEIYAWDLETRRYLRVTRARGEVAGFLVSPRDGAIVYLALARLYLPSGGAGAAPLIAEAELRRIDRADMGNAASAEQAMKLRLDGRGHGATAITLQLDGAGRPLIRVLEEKRETIFSVDFIANTITPVSNGPRRGEALAVRARSAELRAGSATSPPLPPLLTALLRGAAPGYVARSPSGRWVAWSTAGAPCAPDAALRAATLWIAALPSGPPRAVARGEGLGRARFLDDERLIYEDGAGGLRVVGAAGAVEVANLASPGGLALSGIAERSRCEGPEAETPPVALPPMPPGDGDPLVDEGE